MNLSLPKHYSDSLTETLKRFVSEGKKVFYLDELVKQSKVPLNCTENFLLPLLRKDRLEGKLEVRCPKCGRDQGLFCKVSSIPQVLTCDICDLEFSTQREDLQIVLEVKGDFFREYQVAEPLEIYGIPSKQELFQSLKRSIAEQTNAKGKEFELFFESLMKAEKNFEFSWKHPRSPMGEIDYVYTHKIQNSFWAKFSYVCIECKNWKDNISSVEMGHLGDLVDEKAPFACLGVYVTTSAYDPSAYATISKFRFKNKILLVPIEAKHLESLIQDGFEKTIRDVCEHTVFKNKR
jgi:hypothetical protein